MKGFLTRLGERTLGLAPVAKARPLSRFENDAVVPAPADFAADRDDAGDSATFSAAEGLAPATERRSPPTPNPPQTGASFAVPPGSANKANVPPPATTIARPQAEPAAPRRLQADPPATLPPQPGGQAIRATVPASPQQEKSLPAAGLSPAAGGPAFQPRPQAPAINTRAPPGESRAPVNTMASQRATAEPAPRTPESPRAATRIPPVRAEPLSQPAKPPERIPAAQAARPLPPAAKVRPSPPQPAPASPEARADAPVEVVIGRIDVTLPAPAARTPPGPAAGLARIPSLAAYLAGRRV